MKARSFRWRLAIFSALVSGVILVAFGVAAWAFVYKNLLDGVDTRLRGPADRMARRAHEGRDWEQFSEGMRVMEREVALENPILIMANESGKQLFASEEDSARMPWSKDPENFKSHLPSAELLADAPRPAERPPRREDGGSAELVRERDRERPERRPRDPRGPGWKAIGPPEFFTVAAEDGTRWRTVASSNASVTVFMSMDLAKFDAEAKRVRAYFLVALPLGLLAIAFGAWMISRRAMRPLERIIKTTSGMSAAGLDKRIPVTGNESEEFSKLVTELNSMMDRLEVSFHQASRFTADASHELKTPIAIMQAEIESALKSCKPDSAEEESLINLQEENQRLSRITQSLLLLSQADSGKLKLTLEAMNLSDEMGALAEDAELLCAKQGLEFESKIEAGIKVRADRVLLGQAMQNLLSNAIKYNDPDGRVSCGVATEGDQAVVTFFNTGDPIPQEDQEKIFDRFFRVDKARGRDVEGFGLGLNLSLEIVRAHGGTLSLAGSDEEGTRMELRLSIA